MPESLRRASASAAAAVLDTFDEGQRAAACLPMDGPARHAWTYLPGPRVGVSLADLNRRARKVVHRLLATGVSRHTFAQITAIMALEEVLDLDEGGGRGRHSGDFWIVFFGSPNDDEWSWRFEGHHVSVTLTAVSDQVALTPLFLGANPATVAYRNSPLLRPLGLEEEFARELLRELSPAQRSQAVVSDQAPADILTTNAAAVGVVEPLGAGLTGLSSSAALERLVMLYLDRMPPALARSHADAMYQGEMHFAWEGPPDAGAGHYYRVQGPGLLIEYDNTQNGANHAHTVLRHPGDDFGAGLLQRHSLRE